MAEQNGEIKAFEQTKDERNAAHKQPRPSIFKAYDVEASLKEKGFFTLPKYSNAFLTLGVAKEDGEKEVNIGLVMLGKDTEGYLDTTIANPYPGLPENSGKIFLRLSSDEYRDELRNVREQDNESRKLNLERLHNISKQLAEDFLQDRTKILREHEIDPTKVTSAMLSVATSKYVEGTIRR